MGASEEPPLRQDILLYLLTHKAAQDTIAGIVDWWSLEKWIKRRTREVQEVLDQLVTERLLVARTTRDAKTWYRINKRQLKKIRAILQEDHDRTAQPS